MMIGVISTFLYFTIVFVCFEISKIYIIKSKSKSDIKNKLSLSHIIIFSLLFTLFNMFCTSNESEWKGDRINYYRDFTWRRIDSYLSCIIDIIKSFSGSFELLLYSTTFICCLLFFFAYRISKYGTPYSLLCFLCTETVLYSYTRLKQAYAVAIATLLLAIVLNKELTIKKMILCLFLLYLLCGFHVSGYIMVPLVIFIMVSRRKNKIRSIYVIAFVIILGIIFFQPILLFLANMLQTALPQFSNKIYEYFSENELNVGDGSFVYFIKGLPYYYFLLIGFIYRKKLIIKISNYDINLIILLCSSLSYIISIWSYWLKRTSVFFTFTSLIFGIQLINNLDNAKTKRMSYYGVLFYFVALLVRYFYITFLNYGCLI